jgi:uncharacterized membrane protein YgcG
MTQRNRYAAAIAGLVFSLLLMSSPARADVGDNAGILSPQGRSDVENRIDRVRQRTGKTVVVETFPQIPADQRRAFDAATNKAKFYDDWIQQRGLATKADVLLLINMSPGHAEIGESMGVREAGLFTTADRRRVLDDVLVPALKSKNYDQGIAQAVEAIGGALDNNARRGTAAPASPRSSGNAPVAPPSGGTGTGSPRSAPTGGVCGMSGGLGGLLCLVVAGLILFSIVRRIFARRNMPPGGYGAPGYGQPGYGQPGQPGYGGGGGGGFGRGMLGGLLGGVLGGAAYDHFRGGSQAGANPTDPNAGNAPPLPPDTGFSPGPNDFQSSSGADFDSGGGGADFGGGGGGDSGGSSGSDF